MRKARRFRKPAEEEGEYVVANEGRSASFERIFEEDFVRNDRTTERRDRSLLRCTHERSRRIVRIYRHNKPYIIINPRCLDLPSLVKLQRIPPDGHRLECTQMFQEWIRRSGHRDRVAGIA